MKRRELLVAAAGAALVPASLVQAADEQAPVSAADLYSGRLLFDATGKPRIPIGMMERQREIRFSAPQGMLVVAGTQRTKLPPGAEVIVEVQKSTAAIVKEGFEKFVDIHVLCFPEARDGVPVNFVGSVAKAFEPLLRSVCESRGVRYGRTQAKPVNLLVDYHLRVKKIATT